MPGPAPNPNARRRNKESAWSLLPEACTLPVPAWPFPVEPLAEELALWEEIWRTPMATRWHRLRWTGEVALYVRCLVKAALSADVTLASEVRQLGDRLGTTTLAVQKHRWVIDAPEDAKPQQRRRSKSGLRVVQ